MNDLTALSTLHWVALGAFLLPLLALLPGLRRLPPWLALPAVLAGPLALTALLGQRWVESGRPPLQSQYETALFLAWCVGLLALPALALFRRLLPALVLGLVSALVLGLATLAGGKGGSPLPPALASIWFIPHVLVYFFGYACFLAAALLAVVQLVRRAATEAPWLQRPQALADLLVSWGFALITLGMTMGCVWAAEVWGAWWSWDPKETWALLTWLYYLNLLHLRAAGLGDREAALRTLAGLLLIAFTWLGMKFLPSTGADLHVYQ
jgi:ABC-type transport system involved in cytochrome c biogenesis permease subunit